MFFKGSEQKKLLESSSDHSTSRRGCSATGLGVGLGVFSFLGFFITFVTMLQTIRDKEDPKPVIYAALASTAMLLLAVLFCAYARCTKNLTEIAHDQQRDQDPATYQQHSQL